VYNRINTDSQSVIKYAASYIYTFINWLCYVMLYTLFHDFFSQPHTVATPSDLTNIFVTFLNVILFFMF